MFILEALTCISEQYAVVFLVVFWCRSTIEVLPGQICFESSFSPTTTFLYNCGGGGGGSLRATVVGGR